MKRTAAIVLAAGASTRLGEPKQLVMIGSETLLERSVRVATEANCSPVVVVLGSSAEQIRGRCPLASARVVHNPDWIEGMASSIRVGVAVLLDVAGAILTTCDMPAVTPAHLLALADSGEITATAYAGHCGVPAYLPQDMFSSLVNLQGETGAKTLLRNARSIDLVGAEFDVDTQEDLRIARQRFGHRH